MSVPPDAGFAIRRIVAAFGASTASRVALESAVEVAARLGAELEAVFVEDVALLQLAELPFVREMSTHGAAGRPVERAAIERELRALGAEAGRRLAEAAARRRIRLSFKTARGHLPTEIGAAAATADLLILESISRPLARETRLEVPVRQLVAAAARSVLLLQPERPPAGPVHVLLEATAGAVRALGAARELARRYASPLVVTVAGGDRQLEQLVDEAARAAPSGAPVRRRAMGAAGASPLDQLLDAVASGTLVLDVTSPLLEPGPSWERIAKAPCTVLLVR